MNPPVALYLDPVGVCGLKCPTCPRGRMELPTNKAISFDLYCRLLDKAQSEHWIHTLCLYNWGDPLLHPDLPALISEARRRRIWSQISTTLNADTTDFFSCLPDSVIVSLSGWTQATYQIGHVAGKLDKVKREMARLEAAKRWDGKRIEVILTFHRYQHNLHEEAAVAEFARKSRFKFRPVDAIQMALPDILKVVSGKQEPFPGLLQHPRHGMKPGQVTDYCARQSHQLFLNCLGVVQLCCSTHDIDLGNYMEMTWDDIQKLRMKHSMCTVCKKSGASEYMCGAPNWKEKLAQHVIRYRPFWWARRSKLWPTDG